MTRKEAAIRYALENGELDGLKVWLLNGGDIEEYFVKNKKNIKITINEKQFSLSAKEAADIVKGMMPIEFSRQDFVNLYFKLSEEKQKELYNEVFPYYPQVIRTKKNPSSKEILDAVKKLFYAFTDMEFDSYLGTCMKMITRRKNTRINYLYRDASNYKKHNEVIIPGTFTEEQIHTIIDCLQGGEYFIPSEVNLPEIRFEDRTEADHPWFELDEDGFEETEAKVTCHISPEDLVKLFLERKKEWQDEFYMPADWM